MKIYGHYDSVLKKNIVIDMQDMRHGKPCKVMDPINEILEGRYLRQSMEERINKQDIYE